MKKNLVFCVLFFKFYLSKFVIVLNRFRYILVYLVCLVNKYNVPYDYMFNKCLHFGNIKNQVTWVHSLIKCAAHAHGVVPLFPLTHPVRKYNIV
jgi:hypothetical protein